MHQIDLKLGANVYTNNIFRNVKKILSTVRIFLCQIFYGKIVGVLNAKSYVLENDYIDSNCLYSQKRLILQKTLAVSVKAHEKGRCGRPDAYR